MSMNGEHGSFQNPNSGHTITWSISGRRLRFATVENEYEREGFPQSDASIMSERGDVAYWNSRTAKWPVDDYDDLYALWRSLELELSDL